MGHKQHLYAKGYFPVLEEQYNPILEKVIMTIIEPQKATKMNMATGVVMLDRKDMKECLDLFVKLLLMTDGEKLTVNDVELVKGYDNFEDDIIVRLIRSFKQVLASEELEEFKFVVL